MAEGIFPFIRHDEKVLDAILFPFRIQDSSWLDHYSSLYTRNLIKTLLCFQITKPKSPRPFRDFSRSFLFNACPFLKSTNHL